MKNIDLNKVWIGVVAGLLIPALTLWLYYFINYRHISIERLMSFMKYDDTYIRIVSLCVITNLAVFYPFIWKEKWLGAKGVIGATFIWAALIVYLKFFT
jgi:hypothetical protein